MNPLFQPPGGAVAGGGGGGGAPPPPTKLFIASVPWATRVETIRGLFERFGEMTECKLVMDKEDPTKCKGYGFVTYRSAEAARTAVEAMNGYELDGRRIKVDVSQPGASSGGQQGGGGGGAMQHGGASGSRDGGGPTGVINPIGMMLLQTASLRNKAAAQKSFETKKSVKPPLPNEDPFPPFPDEPCPFPDDEAGVADASELGNATKKRKTGDSTAAPSFGGSSSSTSTSTETQNTISKIYVTGLPPDATENELQEFFGKVGAIAKQKQSRGYPDQWPWKIQIYTDKKTGQPKGDASISYSDPNAAQAAPSFFNGVLFRGHTITVELAKVSEYYGN